MRWADIVLSYLRAVAWPVVIIIAIWLFRRQIKTLILSARRVTAFGAEAEFADLEKRVKQTESQLGEPINHEEKPQLSGADIAHRSEPGTVGSISYIDLGNLDSLEPIPAAIQVTKKLQEATSKVLKYFGVPDNAIDPTSAGAILAKITGVEQWTEFVPLVDELGRAANVL